MWEPQLESLSLDCRVVLLDLPGYGLAADRSVPDRLAGFSEEVHRTLEAHLPGPIILVGHSFGGYVALQLYREHPQHFAGLVLTDTRSGPDSEEARAKRLATAQRLQDPAQGLDIEAVAQTLVSSRTWSRRDPILDRVRSIVRSARSTSIVPTLRAIAARPDLTPVLPTVRVPTSVVWGQDDQLIPAEQSESMVARIPGAEGVAIPEAGHIPSLEKPELFAMAIRRVLHRVRHA